MYTVSSVNMIINLRSSRFLTTFAMLLLTLACTCCANDSESNDGATEADSYAVFTQKKLSVPANAGSVETTLKWSATDWRIEFEPDGFITDVSPTEGGNDSELYQKKQITIAFSDNLTGELRSGSVTAINATTGERSTLTVEQSDSRNDFTVEVDTNTTYQHVDGFGGMCNPTIWYRGYLLSTADIQRMYGANGLGYNILRLMVYPDEEDWHYDVAIAKLAQDNNAIIMASPWHCPDAMADTIVRSSDGKAVQHLKHDSYAAYAAHLVRYIEYMRSHGVNVYAMSVQNEPDMSFTYWTPAEVADFVSGYGQTIRDAGVKLLAPEACGTQPQYTDAVINDKAALDRTDIVGGHFYQGFIDTTDSYTRERHRYVSALYDRLGGKPFWMTEHLFNDGVDDSEATNWLFGTWDYCLSHLGRELSMAMQANCGAYLYWVLKRSYGMIGDRDANSPVAEGEVTANGYIMAHFARYATGKYRIKSSTEDNDSLLITAYKDSSNGELAFVIVNTANSDRNVRLAVSGAESSSAVISDSSRRMETLPTGINSKGTEVIVPVAGSSIVSVRVKRQG